MYMNIAKFVSPLSDIKQLLALFLNNNCTFTVNGILCYCSLNSNVGLYVSESVPIKFTLTRDMFTAGSS